MAGPFVSPPKLSNGDVVEELPDDDEMLFAEGKYTEVCDFLAYVKGTNILTNGELNMTLGVSPEFKYDALQMTDIRGVQFHVTVRRPKRD